jgi:hypothetical protein
MVQEAHESGQKIRIAGSMLSPNALGFSDDGMVGPFELNSTPPPLSITNKYHV